MLLPVAFAFTSLVAGETCPAAPDVERRVRATLHLSPEQELSEGFIVERREAGLVVELRSADSTVIGQRTLPTNGSCDELAQAAAVVLSAWLTDVHPDFAGALPTPAPPQGTQESTPEPEPEPKPRPPAPPPASVSVAPARAPVLATVRRHFELGAGLGVQLAAKKSAFSGLASVAYMPERQGLGVSGLVLGVGARREPLAGGYVDWRRWPVAVGPSVRLGSATWTADLTLGPALAWLRLSGDGFSPNRTRDGATWAGFAHLRVATHGKIAIFASALTEYYAPSQAFVGSEDYPLPRLSVTLCVGASISP